MNKVVSMLAAGFIAALATMAFSSEASASGCVRAVYHCYPTVVQPRPFRHVVHRPIVHRPVVYRAVRHIYVAPVVHWCCVGNVWVRCNSRGQVTFSAIRALYPGSRYFE